MGYFPGSCSGVTRSSLPCCMFGLRQTVLIWQINDVDSLKLVSLHCAGLILWPYVKFCSVNHCLKSVQIRSYFCPYFPVFWSVFSCIRTEYRDLLLNTWKYVPEITLYLDTFHAVWYLCNAYYICRLEISVSYPIIMKKLELSIKSKLIFEKKEDLHLPNQKRIEKSCKPIQSTNFMNCSNKEKLNDRYSNIIASGW